MHRTILATAMVLLPLAPATAGGQSDRMPSGMTATEVREHNKTLASTDGGYIRCRKSGETGSLVRQVRVCRTNADWGATFRAGNENARDSVDMMNRGGTNNPN